jgi:hypothetical protein
MVKGKPDVRVSSRRIVLSMEGLRQVHLPCPSILRFGGAGNRLRKGASAGTEKG